MLTSLLKVGNTLYSVNIIGWLRFDKVIFVAISPVFCAMLTSGLSESTSDHVTLQDDVDLSAEVCSIIVNISGWDKVIFVTLSPVFCAMFTSGLSETTSDHITLQDLLKVCSTVVRSPGGGT